MIVLQNAIPRYESGVEKQGVEQIGNAKIWERGHCPERSIDGHFGIILDANRCIFMNIIRKYSNGVQISVGCDAHYLH